MYAILETGGKQIKVAVGDTIYVEKLDVNENETYTFDKVLLISDDKLTVGNPYIEGATVNATVVKQGKSKKIIVFKYKAKSNYKRKYGHRQPYTSLTIDAINA